MSYTFPLDSNNKAGAVKTKNSGNDFVVPVQAAPYDAVKIKRATLTADTNGAMDFGTEYDIFDVMNLGTVDAYVKVGGIAFASAVTAETDEAGILLPAGGAYTMPIKGQTLNWISTGTPKVQAVGVKNNA